MSYKEAHLELFGKKHLGLTRKIAIFDYQLTRFTLLNSQKKSQTQTFGTLA